MSRWSLCALLAVVVLLTAGVLHSGQAGVKAAAGDSSAAVKAAKVAPAKAQPKTAVPKKSPPVTVVPPKGLGSSEAAIERALDSSTDMQFVQLPLDQVIDYLKDYHQIEIQLDKKALDAAGIAEDTAVTTSLKGNPLRSALRLVLHQLKLAFTIHEGVLMITTPEAEKDYLITRFYDVADLVVYQDSKNQQWDDYTPLEDIIISTIDVTSWDAVGGPASVAGASISTAKILVISQTYENHRQVANLLKEIRALAALHSGGGLPRRDRPGPVQKP